MRYFAGIYETPSVNQDKVKEVCEILDSLGFSLGNEYVVGNPKEDIILRAHEYKAHKIKAEKQPIYIARDKNILESLIQSSPDYDSAPEKQAEYGRCMGYPETAVQSYLKEDCLWLECDPRFDFSFFNWFGLSRENLKEELEIPKLWYETIKELSPKLFQKANDISKLLNKTN